VFGEEITVIGTANCFNVATTLHFLFSRTVEEQAMAQMMRKVKKGLL
jgi:hypothetical protein